MMGNYHIRFGMRIRGLQALSPTSLIITAHAFIMIFFMVRKHYYNSIISLKSNKCNLFHTLCSPLGRDNHCKGNDGEEPHRGKSSNCHNNNNSNNSNNNKQPHDATKFVIPNAFYNRTEIRKVAKNAVGVYIFKSKNGHCYVGSSISLYNRVCSYFMPSILAKADRRVLRYFHKYGFKDITLTLYIMNNKATSQMVVQLEQYFMNTLLPTLNVD